MSRVAMPSSVRTVKSADRTIDIFEALAASALPLSMAELSKELDIPKSSLFHLLATLQHRGYVEEASHGRFRIGPRFKEIARSIEGRQSLADIVRPVLESFSGGLNETSGFSVECGDAVEVLCTCTGRQALTYTMRCGDLAPLYAVSAGKAILSSKSPAWLEDYVERVRLEAFTPKTIRTTERLLREVERARSEGVAYVDEEFTPGIIGMAALVRSGELVVGAINVALPTVRATAEHVAMIRQRLFSAVRRFEDVLEAQAHSEQEDRSGRTQNHSYA